MKWLLLASVCASAFGTAAAAQGTGPAQGPAAQDYVVIGEVVVTASRREETVQRAALSIQALSAEDLSRANVTKPEDLSAIAPGVAITTGGNYPQVYIRGVGNFAANSQAEGAVAFNLDGVYISRAPSTRGMFYDLERIEVLKGPQGTLYGRNASGGAINVITAKPKLGEFGGFVDLQAGNYDLRQVSAALNVPLSDTLAVRASGQIVDRDGYLTDGYDDENTKSARLQLFWQPNDDLSLLLNANYQQLDGMGAGMAMKPQLPGDDFTGSTDPRVSAIVQAEPGLGPLLVYPKTDGFVDYTTYAVGAELNWNLGFGTLTVLPAYRQSKMKDLSYAAGFGVAKNDKSEQTSVEARLGNNTPKLKWVLGAYYFDENIEGGEGAGAFQGLSTFFTVSPLLETRSYAAFGQATYSVTDRFRVTGGLRYTYEEKSLSEVLVNYSLPFGGCGAGVFNPFSPYAPQFCVTTIDNTGPRATELTYNNVTYKAGVEYDLAERSMAYANLSTGFKSGGFFSAPPPNTFRPEKLTSFDAGMKNRFLNDRLQVNVEAFYWRYKDHQETSVGSTSLPGFFALLTYNAGRATSYGADLDVIYRVTANDELGFKVQYNKAEYDTFTYVNQSALLGPPATGCEVGPLRPDGTQIVDCSGKQLMRTPEWTGVASYSHEFDLPGGGAIRAGADVQFSSSYWLSTDFLQTGRQDAFAIGNVDLTYTSGDGRVSLSGFVRNVTDEPVYTQITHYAYVSRANPLAGPDGLIIGTLRPPRTYGARLRVNF